MIFDDTLVRALAILVGVWTLDVVVLNVMGFIHSGRGMPRPRWWRVVRIVVNAALVFAVSALFVIAPRTSHQRALEINATLLAAFAITAAIAWLLALVHPLRELRERRIVRRYRSSSVRHRARLAERGMADEAAYLAQMAPAERDWAVTGAIVLSMATLVFAVASARDLLAR